MQTETISTLLEKLSANAIGLNQLLQNMKVRTEKEVEKGFLTDDTFRLCLNDFVNNTDSVLDEIELLSKESE